MNKYCYSVMCHYGNSHGRKAFTLDKETLKLFKKQRKATL